MADRVDPPISPGARAIAAFMCDTYAQMDAYVDKVLAADPTPASCTSCTEAHCCSMLTTISVPEGIALAVALLDRGDVWRAALPRLAAAAREDCAPGVDRRSRFLRRVPCGVLDPATKRCTAYDARPGCCRLHTAVTPARNCSPDAPLTPDASGWSRETASFDFLDLEGALWETTAGLSSEIGVPPMAQAPISLMVLLCAQVVVGGPGNDAELDAALRGLPEEPLHWMVEHAADLHDEEQRNAEEDPRQRTKQEKLYAIGRRVFGGDN
jgi:Fe-S-cluster containining protein